MSLLEAIRVVKEAEALYIMSSWWYWLAFDFWLIIMIVLFTKD
jgi:hypothetical protein